MSITNITYLSQFYANEMFVSNNATKIIFNFSDTIEITKFLANLDIDSIYVVNLEFVYSWLFYEEDGPVITLSKPILISRNSNPRLISNFIHERIRLACDCYYLDDILLEMLSDNDGPGIIVNYSKINIF